MEIDNIDVITELIKSNINQATLEIRGGHMGILCRPFYIIEKDNIIIELYFDFNESENYGNNLIWITVLTRKKGILLNRKKEILFIRRKGHSHHDTHFDVEDEDWNYLTKIIRNKWLKRRKESGTKILKNIMVNK